MKETVEIRIPEEWAAKNLGSLGERIPLELPSGVHLQTSVANSLITRKIVIDVNDPLFPDIDRRIRQEKLRGPIGMSARFRRVYTKNELLSADLFRLIITSVFEPAGEECGTVYDESQACPHCGWGWRQVSDLRLAVNAIPGRADIAKTIAEEIVVSERLVDAFQGAGITGVEFRPVVFPSVTSPKWKPWFQVCITSSPLAVSPQTHFGIDPFDDDEKGEYRCSTGHVAGLTVLSEVQVSKQGWDGSDFICTREMTGVRKGLLRPSPCLLIRPDVLRVLDGINARGFKVEVAHFV